MFEVIITFLLSLPSYQPDDKQVFSFDMPKTEVIKSISDYNLQNTSEAFKKVNLKKLNSEVERFNNYEDKVQFNDITDYKKKKGVLQYNRSSLK